MSVIKQEYTQDGITEYDLLPLSFLQKSVYTGSRDLLRYRIEKKEEECAGEGAETEKRSSLLVTSWITPFCFDKTPDEEKSRAEFPFSEDGLKEIAVYLEALRKKAVRG